MLSGFSKKTASKCEYVAMIIISILFMGAFYSFKELIPSNINWLLWSDDDSAQHYIGWLFYANDAWQFPIGNFSSLSYPQPASVMYMDSIPLFAVLGKLLGFPSSWQYFGFFQLLSFALQGLFAVILLKKYVKSRMQLFLYAFLFLACPIFLWRVNKHVALSAQWIILLSMCSIVYCEEVFQNIRNRVILWSAVGFFCSSIHFYFAPMCGIILVASTCQTFAKSLQSAESWTQRLKNTLHLIIPDYIAYFGSTLLTLGLLGGFSNAVRLSQEAPGWEKSFNLISYFNGQKWSRFLPNIEEYTNGQSEGFAYLGLGVLILLTVLLVMLAVRLVRRLLSEAEDPAYNEVPQYSGTFGVPEIIAFAVMIVLSLIAAISPKVTFGDKLLFTIPIPNRLEQLWYIFRCCGRIAWVSVYCLMLLPAIIFRRCGKKHLLTAFLFLIALIQLYDISEKTWDRGSHVREVTADGNELTSPAWDILQASTPAKTVVKMMDSVMDRYASLGYLCSVHHWNLTSYYFARAIDNSAYTEHSLNNPSEDQLFLFDTDQIELINGLDQFYYYYIDDFIIGYSSEIPELQDIKFTRPVDYAPCSSYELVWNSGVIENDQIDLDGSVQDIDGVPSVVFVGYSYNKEDLSPWTSIYFTVDDTRIDAEPVDREDVIEQTGDSRLLSSGLLGFIPCSLLSEGQTVTIHMEDAVNCKGTQFNVYVS